MVRVMYETWEERASCYDLPTDWWFPDLHSRAKAKFTHEELVAKRICLGCEVRRECLLRALESEDGQRRWGIWGGTTPVERWRMRAEPLPARVEKLLMQMDEQRLEG